MIRLMHTAVAVAMISPSGKALDKALLQYFSQTHIRFFLTLQDFLLVYTMARTDQNHINCLSE